MKYTLIFLAFISFNSFAAYEEGLKRIAYPYWIISDTVNEAISVGQTKFTIRVNNGNISKDQTLLYSANGESFKKKIVNNEISFDIASGSYAFQFYLNDAYFEIYTDSILGRDQHDILMQLRFENALQPVIMDKPIIYLYPDSETDIKLILDPKGDLTFTYPEYTDAWSFTASPDGILTFGEDIYNYLFWESSQNYSLSAEDLKTGYNVAGNEALAFLEEKLDEAGLNSFEKADFITFWGPRLAQNELNFVHFIFNDDCNEFAELEIFPKPKEVFRIYMVWSAIDEPIIASEQEIKSVIRDGFTVIEWGGSEVEIIENSL